MSNISNIKNSILILTVCLLGITITGCLEDNQQDAVPQPEESFIVPSGNGMPDNTCGSGGEFEGCENGGDSRQQLFN